jgi:hypothetical protein
MVAVPILPILPTQETNAYVYGAYVIDDRERISTGKQIQVLFVP